MALISSSSKSPRAVRHTVGCALTWQYDSCKFQNKLWNESRVMAETVFKPCIFVESVEASYFRILDPGYEGLWGHSAPPGAHPGTHKVIHGSRPPPGGIQVAIRDHEGTPGTAQGEDNRRGKRPHNDTTRLMTPRGRRIITKCFTLRYRNFGQQHSRVQTRTKSEIRM